MSAENICKLSDIEGCLDIVEEAEKIIAQEDIDLTSTKIQQEVKKALFDLACLYHGIAIRDSEEEAKIPLSECHNLLEELANKGEINLVKFLDQHKEDILKYAREIKGILELAEAV